MMGSPPHINIKPGYYPEAVTEWYRVTGLRDRKVSACRKDLALKAKQHLLYLGWKFWYIDKTCRWELRYTSPTNGKHHISLRNACKSCIEEGGCSLEQEPSTVVAEEDVVAEEHATVISLSPPSQSRKRSRESQETDESTSDESSDSDSGSDSETSSSSSNSSSSSVQKGSVTPVSVEKTLKTSEPEVTNSVDSGKRGKTLKTPEPQVTNSVDSGRRGKTLKTGVMEKNLEGSEKRGKVLKMNTMKKNSEGFGKRGNVLRMNLRERPSVVSWLIKNQVLVSGTNVFCRGGSNNVVKRGSLSCEGIVCDCCHDVFNITGFEAHAGCTRHRPSESIVLEDGRSLSKCQKEAMRSRNLTENHVDVEENVKENSEANNDNVCAICGFGGDIVLCDRCPSSFHLSCLGLDQVPGGDWFCPTCCCKICYRPKCKEESADNQDNNILVCVQCEQKYHFGCVKTIGFGFNHMESNAIKKNWFCSVACGNMVLCLKNMLGKPIQLADNLTWTLLKNVSSDDDGGGFNSDEFGQKKSKLNVILGVLYESFNPTIDAFSGRELIKDVVFSRDSEHNRLNFRGFYNVILEKMGEVISVATIRIYGQKVAEIVFVATKKQYRARGMCRLLMDELEKQLTRLGVGSMVLHSSENALDTWTKSFGFARMTSKDKCQFIDNTFLEFHNTIMCLKPLNRPIWPCMA